MPPNTTPAETDRNPPNTDKPQRQRQCALLAQGKAVWQQLHMVGAWDNRDQTKERGGGGCWMLTFWSSCFNQVVEPRRRYMIKPRGPRHYANVFKSVMEP